MREQKWSTEKHGRSNLRGDLCYPGTEVYIQKLGEKYFVAMEGNGKKFVISYKRDGRTRLFSKQTAKKKGLRIAHSRLWIQMIFGENANG